MLTLWTAMALAQTVPDVQGSVQTQHLAVGGDRLVWTDDAARDADGTVVGRLVGSYAHRPLVWEWSDGTTDAVVGGVWQLDALAAASYGGARLGIDLPVVVADSDVVRLGRGGLGDMALDARYTLLDPETRPLGLAVAGRVGLPTATVRVPLGADGVTWELTAIADRELGPLQLAANVGTRGGPPTQLGDTEVDDQLVWRLGAGWEASLDVGLSAEVAGRVAYAGPLAAGSPTEGLLGGWAWLTESVMARAGVGAGLGRSIGTPGARVLVGFVFSPPGSEVP